MTPIDRPPGDPGDPTRDRLDPEERALAQALRALPVGSPPPELDARILAAARAAVDGPAPTRRRGLAGVGAGTWGWLGTAAAAVLAVGVTLRMGGEDPGAPAGLQAEVTAQGAAEERRRAEADDAAAGRVDAIGAVEVEAVAARADAPVAAVPAPAARSPERREMPRAPAPAAPAPPPPPPVASAPVPAAPVAAAEAADTGPGQTQDLDRITVTGSRVDRADIALDAPVADDARLDPLAWIHRIRDRRDGGDLAGARESLDLFEQAHPRIAVPDDLEPLRE